MKLLKLLLKLLSRGNQIASIIRRYTRADRYQTVSSKVSNSFPEGYHYIFLRKSVLRFVNRERWRKCVVTDKVVSNRWHRTRFHGQNVRGGKANYDAIWIFFQLELTISIATQFSYLYVMSAIFDYNVRYISCNVIIFWISSYYFEFVFINKKKN